MNCSPEAFIGEDPHFTGARNLYPTIPGMSRLSTFAFIPTMRIAEYVWDSGVDALVCPSSHGLRRSRGAGAAPFWQMGGIAWPPSDLQCPSQIRWGGYRLGSLIYSIDLPSVDRAPLGFILNPRRWF